VLCAGLLVNSSLQEEGKGKRVSVDVAVEVVKLLFELKLPMQVVAG
jgi:hypothetical protein